MKLFRFTLFLSYPPKKKAFSFKTLHCAAGGVIYSRMKHIKILIKKFFLDLLEEHGVSKGNGMRKGLKTFMFSSQYQLYYDKDVARY